MPCALALILVCCVVSLLRAETELTVYAGGFAVVRESLPLDLHAGVNEIRFDNVTEKLDHGTAVLRDPSGKSGFQVLEQTYHSAAPGMLKALADYEGQTIDFLVKESDRNSIVRGKVVRAGVNPEMLGNQSQQWADPIIEVDGKVQFRLPGIPLFPHLPAGTVIKPDLVWKISAPKAAKVDGNLTYLTDGLSWSADYSAILDESGMIRSLKGFISVTNQTGRSFEQARVTVIAGDVDRQQPAEAERVIVTGSNVPLERNPGPYMQSKYFDEYHAYPLKEPIALHEAETKQAGFMQAENVVAKRSFVYEGGSQSENVREDAALLGPALASQSITRVSIECDFKNDKASKLGLPLPRGRWHFFRLDESQRLDFIGDAGLQDIPENEEVRARMGNAFDLVGERRQTKFNYDEAKHTLEESFEIKLRNHRPQPVEIRVIEHPFRWRDWKIIAQSDPVVDSNTNAIEFHASVQPNAERVVTYTILYSHIPIPRDAE
jgi:hypothetical protein